MWLFGPNDDYVGQTLETDAMFSLDGHLSRDFTEHLWGSLDTVYYTGGAATLNGVTGEKLNNFGAGFTLGYTINENLSMTFGYKSTFKDIDPADLRMDNFTVSLTYGWHSLIEGMNRLKGGD